MTRVSDRQVPVDDTGRTAPTCRHLLQSLTYARAHDWHIKRPESYLALVMRTPDRCFLHGIKPTVDLHKDQLDAIVTGNRSRELHDQALLNLNVHDNEHVNILRSSLGWWNYTWITWNARFQAWCQHRRAK